MITTAAQRNVTAPAESLSGLFCHRWRRRVVWYERRVAAGTGDPAAKPARLAKLCGDFGAPSVLGAADLICDAALTEPDTASHHGHVQEPAFAILLGCSAR